MAFGRNQSVRICVSKSHYGRRLSKIVIRSNKSMSGMAFF